MIRLFVADDHAIVLKGLEAMIEAQPDMEVVGTAANGEAAVEGVAATRPDVIVVDIRMPLKNGLHVIKEVKNNMPEARILVLSSYDDNDLVFAAIKAGALGYLLKDSSPQDLLTAIRKVYAGRASLDSEVARRLIEEISRPPAGKPLTGEPLTDRELEVLRLVARGYSNKAIAEQLVLSERTVRTHMTNVLGKLHLASRTQAALYALKHGISQLDDV